MVSCLQLYETEYSILRARKYFSVLQSILRPTIHYSILQNPTPYYTELLPTTMYYSVLDRTTTYCKVLARNTK